MYHMTNDEHDCCGCRACEKICKFEAIQMHQNEKGFYYPIVDSGKCAHCGRCAQVCPMEKNCVGINSKPDIYAAICKDGQVVKKSSSGGVFSVLCKWVINQGGIVYGAAFSEDYSEVRHMRAVTLEESKKFRGSKYIESSLKEIYEQLEEDLKSGRTVLFSGTPCQVSAVKAFLKLQKVSAEKFYTCDIICHGVPSPKVWKDYLELVRNKYLHGKKIVSVNMRSKSRSWESQALEIGLDCGNINQEIKRFSFNTLFHSLYLQRESCFQCRYTSYLRPGDVTLGDFWNYRQAHLAFKPEFGISEVLVNSAKGRDLWSIISEELFTQKISQKVSWQAHLEYSAKEPAARETFWKEYSSANRNDEKERVLQKYMKGSIVTRVIRTIGPVLRKMGLYSFAGKAYQKIMK